MCLIYLLCEVLEQIQLCKLGVTEVLVFFLFRIKFLWSRSTYSTDLNFVWR